MTPIERVARAIAKENGDDFDEIHDDKPHWNATRGHAGGRFRDINEPRKGDYLEMARAAIAALEEPSEGMLIKLSQTCQDERRCWDDTSPSFVWREMIRAALTEYDGGTP